MANFEIRRTGDWPQARRVMSGLAFKLHRVTERGLKEEAEAAVRRIKNNIFAQNYPHAPLSEWQREHKAKTGGDPRTLIEEGKYVRAIDSFRIGRGQYAIGFRAGDERNAERAKLLEFGGKNNLGRYVPARPHFRVELERMRNGRIPTIRKGIHKVLTGRWI